MPDKEILVVLIEDEEAIRKLLRVTLADHRFRIVEATTASDGINSIFEEKPDLILLDLGLPDSDGFNVIEAVRKRSNTPIIVISARGQEQDKILALNAGADDYVTKPFGMGELTARMRAALRRMMPAKEQDSVLTFGELKVDLTNRSVFLAGKEVHLTPTEYDLLMMFINNVGRVLTHNQLLKSVWGDQYLGETHYVRVYMAQLRQKLEIDPARPKYFRTEPGIGYRFQSPTTGA